MTVKRILGFFLVFVIGVAVGAVGLIKGDPSLLSKRPAPVVESLPVNPLTAISVTEANIESNLAGSSHYVRFDVEFLVAPQALKAQGGNSQGGGSSGGTGSAALDARIRNALIDLARATTYSELTNSGGLSTFRLRVSEVLQSIFGPGTVAHIYFPTLVTQ